MHTSTRATTNAPLHPQHNQTDRTKNAGRNAGLTEILLSNFDNSHLDMVLPMLAYLSRTTPKNKWFTWIAPDGVSKSMLELHGFDLSNIRLIHTSSDKETLWTFWEALSNGNSDVVVATCRTLTKKNFHELNRAANLGNSRGLVLCGA